MESVLISAILVEPRTKHPVTVFGSDPETNEPVTLHTEMLDDGTIPITRRMILQHIVLSRTAEDCLATIAIGTTTRT